MRKLKRGNPIDWSGWRPQPGEECEASDGGRMKSIEQLKEEAEAIKRDPTRLTSWDVPISFNEYHQRLMAGEYDEKT